MKLSSFAVSHWILVANAWLALLETVEASCGSCTFLGPLVDSSCESDCHTHNAPCLGDVFLYPYPAVKPSNGYFSGNVPVCTSCPLFQTFVDAQGFANYNPNVNEAFASCNPTYNKVVGSCSGYAKTIDNQDLAFCSPFPPTNINVPWTSDCTYTIETAKGNLMLQGSLPSQEQCLINLFLQGSVIGSNQPLVDYMLGYTLDDESLVGKCCSDFAITGGTDAYCSAEGSVRVCRLIDSTVNVPQAQNAICSGGTTPGNSLSFNFDGLKGCQRNECCDAPKAICG